MVNKLAKSIEFLVVEHLEKENRKLKKELISSLKKFIDLKRVQPCSGLSYEHAKQFIYDPIAKMEKRVEKLKEELKNGWIKL